MDELNYEKDMTIDETALDVEWAVTQPALAAKYNQHFAIMCKKLDIAHEDVKTVRSDLIKRANKFPDRCCNKPKPNAQDIEAYYRTHRKYKRVRTKMIDIEYEKNMAEMAKNEINFTRKAALEHLVTLLGQQYFAGPRLPRDLHIESKKRRKQIENNLSKKSSKSMIRKKKKRSKNG